MKLLFKKLQNIRSKKLNLKPAKVFLEIAENSQKNTRARVSFLIKLQSSGFSASVNPSDILIKNVPKFIDKDFHSKTEKNLNDNKIISNPCSIYEKTFSTRCVKSVQIRSFFWSVFSRFRTEYGDLRSKLDTFHAVTGSWSHLQSPKWFTKDTGWKKLWNFA